MKITIILLIINKFKNFLFYNFRNIKLFATVVKINIIKKFVVLFKLYIE